MYLTEIVLDGFKSYAERTVISGFDRKFNAVTGLNGSGKSNILDAICFVLGISNHSLIRCHNLQEVVYKMGQAGISRASVTLIFDNSDKEQSPQGYEDCSSISVQRTYIISKKISKYYINGSNATQQQVTNLFLSCQLNVNNPQFLIMQGKVTKMMNAKPLELLGMIEETAGTGMYELKSQQASKTISKKEQKLKEINETIEREITPTLQTLKEQREQYIKYSSGKQEIEKLEKLSIAYTYQVCFQSISHSAEERQSILHEKEKVEKKQKELKLSIENIDKQINDLKTQLNGELCSALEILEAQVNEVNKNVVKLSTEVEHKESNLESERTKLKKIQQQLEELVNQIQSTQKKIEHVSASQQEQKETTTLTKQLENLQKQFESISAGIAASGTSGLTLTEQLMECKQKIVDASAEESQCVLKVKHLEQLKQEYTASLVNADSEYAKIQSQYTTLQNRVQQLKKEMESIGYDNNKWKQLVQQKKDQESKMNQLQKDADALHTELGGRFDFYYEMPVKDFDANSVKGVVANLFEMKEDSGAIALEVAAGGKLYQIIVKDEKVAKLLIEKGKTNSRITVIPLNNVRYDTLPLEVQEKAKEMGASPALVWIKFDAELESAMKYVFGTTLVCQDIDTAEKVALHKDIRRKTVTLRGDSFDPSGTLTGGSRGIKNLNDASLKKLSMYKKIKEEQNQIQKYVEKELNPAIQRMQQLQDQYSQIEKKYQVAVHECKLVESEMALSAKGQLLEKLNQTEKTLKEMNELFMKARKTREENEVLCKQIEKEITDFESQGKSGREKQLKQIEKQIQDTKYQLQTAKLNSKNQEHLKQKLESELEELSNEKIELESQIDSLQKEMEVMQQALQKLYKDRNNANQLLEQKQQLLEEKQSVAKNSNKEIASLGNKKNYQQKELTEVVIELKKVESAWNKLEKDGRDAEQTIQNLQRQHAWIRSDKQFFGQVGTDYDFSAYKSLKHLQDILHSLKENQETLSKTVNKKVMSMYEKAEFEYNELLKKRAIVENDKGRIEKAMEDLSTKKYEAIENTYQKLNENFQNIFSTLLPGASAKLVPSGNSILEGLEVKVAFGNVWKESLTELSGGQKSLLALSLILSTLMFKPAPMYILDEVDAALDPSHTQNIGKMFSTYFAKSQFLVVSLKEGMYKYANVLFTTCFVNGQSTVTRTLQNNSNNSQKENRSSLTSSINKTVEESERLQQRNSNTNNTRRVV